MEDKGKCHVLVDINGDVIGILSIKKEEEDNLKKYGDFAEIDGTIIPNFLEWTTIPIAIQGNLGELRSGGLAFSVSENCEFYNWLISTLLLYSPKLKCIISDEDSGICSAMNNFPNIFHLLCIKHKIAKVLNLISRTNPKKEEYYALVNTFFYSRSIKESTESIYKIYQNFPEVRNYFEANIYPIRHKLLISMRPDIFTFNHSSSQLIESYNNMIKQNLDCRIKHFTEIREHVSLKFRLKHSYEEEIMKNSFISKHFLNTSYGLNLSRKICEMVDNEIINSQYIVINQSETDQWTAIEGNKLQFKLNFINCECHFTANAGIPCRHLLSLYRLNRLDFPVHLINPRFFEKSNDSSTDVSNDIYFEFEENEEEDGLFIPEESSESESGFEYESDDEENLDQDVYSKEYNLLPTFNQTNSYNELMIISREISVAGSQNSTVFENIKSDLLRIKEKYKKNTGFGEVMEKTGRRRGRPKGKNFSKNSRIK